MMMTMMLSAMFSTINNKQGRRCAPARQGRPSSGSELLSTIADGGHTTQHSSNAHALNELTYATPISTVTHSVYGRNGSRGRTPLVEEEGKGGEEARGKQG